jgi:hypothetical protein
VRLEEPVVVSMSDAERSAAVASLADILAAWWARQQETDHRPDAGSSDELA